jgi:hypothetical protein
MRHFFCTLILALTGCAHYEFDLVQPPPLAQHIGDSQMRVVKVDPLEYRMQSAENRLVIEIFNPTQESIVLLGRLSSVVDPVGESHPLMDRAIPPGSFIKLILPPMPPEAEANGPTVNIGFGASSGRRDSDDQPVYLDTVYAGNPYLWNWPGEGDVRLSLIFQRGNANFRQEFTFHKRKM